MPELPDVTAYLVALEPRVLGHRLTGIRIASPFVLRSVDPPLREAFGKTVVGLRRLGKRIVFELATDEAREEAAIFIVIHLMIAGRLHWKDVPAARIPGGKRGLAAFDFSTGTLLFTEEGTKKRAALYLVRGEEALAAHDPGGLDPLMADRAAFAAALTRESHTVKRALTDPRFFSGIGNAYSDEILHRAHLSPIKLTRQLSEDEIERLHTATRVTLAEWIGRLSAEARETFPEKVTAFRPDMAVHGRYGKPCPECGAPVQRIVHADNETNYCAGCQTGGRLLADRALSRLLHQDWPKTLEELENLRVK
ncbi:MAG TPA: DNA-formamidopyrimidine glycosylase family protein [Methylomirabilota bacterium]|jgi:formamidopyrimidine-DNA glycosylase|nr:DNA-formamidopyrimidine glycosylase family protein [Methylomirabilota bacterium]